MAGESVWAKSILTLGHEQPQRSPAVVLAQLLVPQSATVHANQTLPEPPLTTRN